MMVPTSLPRSTKNIVARQQPSAALATPCLGPRLHILKGIHSHLSFKSLIQSCYIQMEIFSSLYYFRTKRYDVSHRTTPLLETISPLILSSPSNTKTRRSMHLVYMIQEWHHIQCDLFIERPFQKIKITYLHKYWVVRSKILFLFHEQLLLVERRKQVGRAIYLIFNVHV